MIDFRALSAPFSPLAVSWRVGSTTSDKTKGMALAYLDARDVMDRLDEVCGPQGWQCRYSHVGPTTVCEISIWCSTDGLGMWLSKADGAGQSDIEAEKGALSDAFKRAAVRWGIGRYLYNLPSPWVEIEGRGKSYIIKQSEYPRLAELLRKHSGGEKAMPEPAPQETDVEEGSVRWVAQQKNILANLANAEDVKKWLDNNDKQLRKLGRDTPLLWDEVKAAYKKAKERTVASGPILQ